MSEPGEASRLEALWREQFGVEYIERNRSASVGREPFWRWLHEQHPFRTALEVGCNIGGNLRWLTELIEPADVYGVDINEHALREARKGFPDTNVLRSPARKLPFRDGFFDLTFTTVVLIHQPPETLPVVMNEIVRCSRKYVLCGEYFSEQLEEVPYRGQSGALFKRDFGGLYQSLFPELKLIHQRYEPLAEDGTGWDDVTFWLFEKTG